MGSSTEVVGKLFMIVAAQNFGQQTAAQIFAKISASTRRHRCNPKSFARKKFAGRRPANFFRDRLGRTGFYDQKGLFYDRKGFRFDATSFARGGRSQTLRRNSISTSIFAMPNTSSSRQIARIAPIWTKKTRFSSQR